MELRQLQAFVAVATQLHFGRAAEQLSIGQPTVSELVQRLERELGTPLLARSTRPVRLTEAGQAFLGPAARTVRDAESARDAVNAVLAADGVATVVVDCEAGPVRLGLAGRVAAAAGAPLVALADLSADRVAGVVRAVRAA